MITGFINQLKVGITPTFFVYCFVFEDYDFRIFSLVLLRCISIASPSKQINLLHITAHNNPSHFIYKH